MYYNKCTKCGKEFETRNPKRVICPDCLYPEKSQEGSEKTYTERQDTGSFGGERSGGSYNREGQSGGYNRGGGSYNREGQSGGYNRGGGSYNREGQSGGYNRGGGSYNREGQSGGYNRPSGSYNREGQSGGYNRPSGSYNREGQSGGYNRPSGSYNREGQSGGYNRPSGSYNREGQSGGFNRPGGSYNRDGQSGGFNRPGGSYNRGGGFNRGGGRRPAPKQLLISREQVAQIEALYRTMLPLPNPDAHEVIGEKIGLESQKVFFGINLVRQKMMLPKLPFPKRKLAVSPDQLMAIQNLYSPLLPLPPIGCHKILAQQLKMDEWRVHVGIGIVRKQMNLPRWNSEREDAPEEFKNPPAKKEEADVKEKKTTKKSSEKAEKAEKIKEEKEVKEKKTTKKSAAKKEAEPAEVTEAVEEAPKKRGRTKKDTQAE